CRRARRQTESERSSPFCPQPDHNRSSFPCSRARWPTLLSCFFQVCAFALFLLTNQIGPVTMLPLHAVVRASEPVELPPKCEKRERRSFRPHIREGRQLRSTRGPSY